MELNWKKFTELLLKIMTESSEDCYPFESCNYCDKYLQPNWKYCPYCGESINGYK
jgi:uncharacterized OB-fold protein